MLNSAQQEAVNKLRGPVLVLAGAGTGKTHTVTCRIANLIQHGTLPNRILAVTFTNKAAKEMQQRVGKLVTSKQQRVEISTFHSLCVKILRRHITKLGYPPQFAIYDRGDCESVARTVLKEIKVQESALKPGELLTKISAWKNSGIAAGNLEMHLSAKDYLAFLAYPKYQAALKIAGAVDFDDLLRLTEELFQQFPDVLKIEAGRIDHILVDEYQDTNMSQYRIIKGLALPHRNLCVVGDDDQAIYGWRGADVKHILSFQKDWTDAKVIRLEENYRSTKQILLWANELIRHNKQRHGKTLTSMQDGSKPVIVQCKDRETEAKQVVADIKARIGEQHVQPRDIAVLFRTNEQPRAFETEFRKEKIPYTLIGSQSFFDRKEVRDILAYLKVLNRPIDDISLLRIINTPPRGIGHTQLQRLTENALKENKPIWEVLGRGESKVESGELFSGNVQLSTVNSPLSKFHQLIESLRTLLHQKFSIDNLNTFIADIQYEKEINRQYPELQERGERWDSVGEVINAAAGYIRDCEEDKRKPVLWEFLDNTTLGDADFTSSKQDKFKQNTVTLMTLHAAKGLEFDEVYMVGMIEGILPHHRSVKESMDENLDTTFDATAIDEERRLCYVGITRAKHRLMLTLPLSEMKWGKSRPTVPSRFLYEITQQTINPNYHRAIAGQPPKKNPTHHTEHDV